MPAKKNTQTKSRPPQGNETVSVSLKGDALDTLQKMLAGEEVESTPKQQPTRKKGTTSTGVQQNSRRTPVKKAVAGKSKKSAYEARVEADSAFYEGYIETCLGDTRVQEEVAELEHAIQLGISAEAERKAAYQWRVVVNTAYRLACDRADHLLGKLARERDTLVESTRACELAGGIKVSSALKGSETGKRLSEIDAAMSRVKNAMGIVIGEKLGISPNRALEILKAEDSQYESSNKPS